MQTSMRVYKQKRRWAWGIENFPVVMRALLKNRNISLYNKIRYGFKLFERAISWATWPFLLAVCVLLSLLLIPKRDDKHGLFKRIKHVLEWIFLPIVSILLSGIPALDAQTRLMIGKELAFWVTPKER